MSDRLQDGPVVILIPIFNDWTALAMLLDELEAVLERSDVKADIVLIDDGSTEPMSAAIRERHNRWIQRIDVLSLRRNLGHQRALAIGLAYVEAKLKGRLIVVMDGDGEDAAADVPRLLARSEELAGGRIVFAERTWRSERLLFRICYRLYKFIHLTLTGTTIRVGNFSVVPRHLLNRLVVVSDLWNHYPAAVYRARLPIEHVPTRRAKRLSGESHMNFTALVIHGLSAVSVFGDRVGVRLMSALLVIAGLGVTLLVALLAVHIGSGSPMPAWIFLAGGLALNTLLQLFLVALVFVFILLSSRETSSFLPARDYEYFVGSFRPVCAGRDG